MQASLADSITPRSATERSTISVRKRSSPAPGSGSVRQSVAISITASICVSTMAWIRSSLLGKRRNSVASPTPARWAISAVEASSPRSAKTSIAAAMIRSRLRWASARSSRAVASVVAMSPIVCAIASGSIVLTRPPRPDRRRPRRCGRRRAGAAARWSTTAAAADQRGRDHERDLEPVHERRALLRAVRERVRRPVVGERREHREPERAAHLLRGVEHARGEPGVLLGDVRGRDQGQGHEGQAHADRQRRERGEQRRVGAVDRGRRREHREPDRRQRRADREHALGPEAADQLLREHRADHDPEAHRQERDAGLERRVAEHLLQVQGAEEEHREHPGEDQQHHAVGGRQRAQPEQVEAHQRRVRAPLDRPRRRPAAPRRAPIRPRVEAEPQPQSVDLTIA